MQWQYHYQRVTFAWNRLYPNAGGGGRNHGNYVPHTDLGRQQNWRDAVVIMDKLLGIVYRTRVDTQTQVGWH